ncbi:MAG: YgiT-type zinc finger protein [Candidatus Promineifilaceae bacterium]|jgi:YgiT-type zinc finger domain-containing protein
MKCPYCKGEMHEEFLDYVVEMEDGQKLRLEEVPTWVCEKCDYTEIEEEVGEAIEDMLDHLDTVEAGSDEEE